MTERIINISIREAITTTATIGNMDRIMLVIISRRVILGRVAVQPEQALVLLLRQMIENIRGSPIGIKNKKMI